MAPTSPFHPTFSLPEKSILYAPATGRVFADILCGNKHVESAFKLHSGSPTKCSLKNARVTTTTPSGLRIYAGYREDAAFEISDFPFASNGIDMPASAHGYSATHF